MALPVTGTANPKPNAKPNAKPKPGKGNKNLAKAAAGPVPGSAAYQAQQEIDPIIAAIKAAALSQAGSADKAIEGLTNSYAQGIAGINYGAPYSSGEAQQAAVDNALRQSASGQGSDLAAALSQRLQALQGSSGAGAVNQEAAALANQGAGIGNADLAGGSAELGQLIADAAAAKSYGQKMPGVIRSAGLQGISQAQGQAQQAINQGTLQAESQLPSIIQTIKADKQAAQQAKVDQAYKQAEMAYKQASLNSTNAYRGAELKLRGQALAQSQQRIQIEAAKAADQHNLAWKRLGIEDRHLKLEIAKQALAAKSGGLSATEISRYGAIADSWITRTTGHTRDATTGKVEPMLTLKEAGINAMKEGVPIQVFVEKALQNAKKTGQYAETKAYINANFGGLLGAVNKAKMPPLPGTAQAIGSLAFAGEKGLRTPAQRKIVALAHEYMGTPYVWGGESPKGFDCSGFAQYLYGKAGISIPRTTYTQWTAGRPISQNQLRPGDLVFFKGSDSRGGLPGHVGIYIGGDKMIDAPHSGADVRIESVGSFGGYMGARRYGSG